MVERVAARLPEAAELETLVEAVSEVAAAGGSALELGSQRLSLLVRRYCECPRLLEPLVAELVPRLSALALRTDGAHPTGEARAALLYSYHIVRARGYKRAVVHFPHEVSYLRPILTFLENEDPQDKENWHCRFVLLLWLSIIVMMPFHLSLLDAHPRDDRGEKTHTVMSRIFNICKTYSLVSDSCALAGAFLTSKFLTRSDVLEIYLGEFFEWSSRQNRNLQDEDCIKYGVLASVATILKHGKREDMLCYTDDIFRWIVKQNYQSSKSITIKKYGVKIIQRIGLILLKPRLAAWRYIRETSSLAVNLQANNDLKMNTVERNPGYLINDPENIDDQDIPEQLEDIIEHLLMGLRDGDNIVRWSAAKGIGRVAARLNCSAAGDIVTGIMDLFNPHEGDGAWHGGCLALAELGRRGLLLTCHLRDAVSVVLPALQYEEVKGYTPTGAHVRDAACYVCWAFVRAYTEDLNPYIIELIVGLMITAVFDREINCRLAARAAFEESVGRLQIINAENLVILTADEFFLSSTKKAYLCAAPYIATVNKRYTQPLIDHLVEKKINHWDINIRELASKSLHMLTEKNPQYMSEKILSELLSKSCSTDLNTRHGSILAIGEILHALRLNGTTSVSNFIFSGVKNIVPLMKSKYQFRGLGGELMRQACCSCIENLSLAKMKYHGQDIIDEWLELIEECLSHEVNTIRSKAIPSLAAIFNEYLNEKAFRKDYVCITSSQNHINVNFDDYKNQLKDKRQILLSKYCVQLKIITANGLQTRMGYALAIGSLPSFVLEEQLPQIVSSLIQCAEVTEPTLKWTESRRDALKGLTTICKTVGVKKLNVENDAGCNYNIRAIFDCMLKSLNEYTIEKRGDTGAWVREASVAGLSSLCKQCAEEDESVFCLELVTKVMVGITQQSMEKIDRIRALAGKTFTALLYNDPKIPFIPHHKDLLNIFPPTLEIMESETCSAEKNTQFPLASIKPDDEDSQNKSAVLWLFPEHTMPLFIKLLAWDVYRYNVILGLTISAGEMTESLVKHSTSSLFSYMTSLYNDRKTMIDVCNVIVRVFADFHQVDRVMVPMLKFLDRLLSSGCISIVLEDSTCSFANDILELVKTGIKNTKSIYKLLDCISVLCQIIQVGGDICRKSLSKLVIYMCHPDKYLRKATATKLYDALLIYGDATLIPSENMDQIMTVLGETNWELDVATLKPIRNDLCTLMNISQPILIKKEPLPNK